MSSKTEVKNIRRNKLRRFIIAFVALFSGLGFFLTSFSTQSPSLAPYGVFSQDKAQAQMQNSSPINQKSSNDTNLDNIYSRTKSGKLGAAPITLNSTLFNVSAIPAPVSGSDPTASDNWASKWIRDVRNDANLNSLLQTNATFKNWAEGMVTKPMTDPNANRNNYFTSTSLLPVLNSVNGVGATLSDGDQMQLTLPTAGYVDITTPGTPIPPAPTQFVVKVAEFNTKDKGYGVIGYSNAGAGTPIANGTIVFDNSNGQLAQGTLADAVQRGDIFLREDTDYTNPTPKPINNVFQTTINNGVVSVYATVGASQTINLWTPNLSGTASKISSFKLGFLSLLNVLPTSISPSPVLTPLDFGAYSERMNVPPVANQNKHFTFYLKKGAELVTTLQTDSHNISDNFNFKFDGTNVIYNSGSSDVSSNSISIPDTSWTDGTTYDFTIDYAIGTSGDFAKITLDYNPTIFDIVDSNNNINLDNGVTTFFYQGIYFETPPVANFGPDTSQTLTGKKTTDPQRLAKLTLAKVFEQWAGRNNGLPLSSNLTLSYQGVYGDPNNPPSTTWDEVVQDHNNVNGQWIYNILTSQTSLEYGIQQHLNITPTIHGDKDSSTYYTLNPTDDSLNYLQAKVFDFISDTAFSPSINAVLNLLKAGNSGKGYEDIADVPNSLYPDIEKQLLPIIQATIQENFSQFKLKIYSRVYGAYAQSLTATNTAAAQLINNDANPISVVNGDVTKDDALLKITNPQLINGVPENFNAQVVQNYINFINKYQFGKTIFPDSFNYAIYSKIANTDDFINPDVYTQPQLKSKADDTFRLFDELFTWLKVPVGDILKLALDPNTNPTQISNLLMRSMQQVILNLVSSDQAQSTTYQSTTYTTSTLQTLVANNNIRVTLNQIDLTGRSDLYKANLALAKQADFRNFDITRQYGLATENYDIDQYVNNFANGSSTVFFSNQIKKLDFANPNLFLVPEPTSFVKKVLEESKWIMAGILTVSGAVFVGLSLMAKIKAKGIKSSSISTNVVSKRLINGTIITLAVIGIVAIVFSVLLVSGVFGASLIPFVST